MISQKKRRAILNAVSEACHDAFGASRGTDGIDSSRAEELEKIHAALWNMEAAAYKRIEDIFYSAKPRRKTK